MFSSIYPQPVAKKHPASPAIRFPEDVQVIIRSDRPAYGNLFVGNLEAALNPLLLENLQIGAILSLAKGHAPSKEAARYAKYVPLSDDDKDALLPYLDECNDFLADRLSQTNVLVHCIAGVSRAPAVAIAFLMRERRLSLEDAFSEVKSRRKIICPSASIMQQLHAYQQQVVSKRPARASSLKNPQPAKSRLPSEASQKPSLNRANSSKIRVEDLEDGKSVRSQAKSVRTNRQDTAINISVLAPTKSKRGQNPEESFLSKGDKVPSELNKSFATSKPPSEKKQPTEQSFLDSENPSVPELPQVMLTKKASSSRDDFTKRVGLLDLRNFQINNKIVQIQQKFEQQEKCSRISFQNELQEINEMKSSISSHMSERRSRVTERAKFHDTTMEDKQVKEYIINSLQTAHW